MKKVKKIFNVFSTIVVAVVVAMSVLLVGVRFFGLTPYCIMSGSMEPVYKTGSLIYVKGVDAEDVSVGDTITFVLNKDLVVATHRVVENDKENGRFITKGDANDAIDGAPVLYENLIGRPMFSIPYLGYISHYATNAPGKYLTIAFIVVAVLLAFVPDAIEKAEKKKAVKIQECDVPKSG